MTATEKCAALVVNTDPSDFLTARLRRLGAFAESVEPEGMAAQLASRTWDLVIVDLGVADAPEMITRALASGRVRIAYGLMIEGRSDPIGAAMGAGAVDVLSRSVIAARMEEIVEQASLRRPSSIAGWRDALGLELHGEDARTLELLGLIRKVAATHSTVLITGESGTGKELIASSIHKASPRARKPMVAINCAALPDNLIESELFGHARGAFTGADRARDGKLVAADGGTLFLDEVGELPLAAQAKLLRVLQEQKVTPVGSNVAVPVDVRIVAATNRDLETQVAEGRFRADLYFRLNVVHLEASPLRDRVGDILPLARLFLARANLRHGGQVTGFAADAEEALVNHRWPGNVRELGNVIERAVVLADGGPLRASCLRLATPRVITSVPAVPNVAAANTNTNHAAPEGPSLNLRAALDQVERRYIERALERADGNRTEAAALLGLNRTTLVEKIRKLNAA